MLEVKSRVARRSSRPRSSSSSSIPSSRWRICTSSTTRSPGIAAWRRRTIRVRTCSPIAREAAFKRDQEIAARYHAAQRRQVGRHDAADPHRLHHLAAAGKRCDARSEDHHHVACGVLAGSPANSSQAPTGGENAPPVSSAICRSNGSSGGASANSFDQPVVTPIAFMPSTASSLVSTIISRASRRLLEGTSRGTVRVRRGDLDRPPGRRSPGSPERSA